ncbi:acyltransferase family protein [Thermomonospora cellulosilytica]|uniref:Fucose 4-O-acetylase-like acetyltransferase n=1 Tax=Thermomonospora cellulosilytica TaxID=1411118 RepID=A0A7W3RCC9_9ACTN|nr:acyltransferase family protein [Thermomonospora cellulosilytica]MBA9007952.1 fucose 4-O-acetylase-like acetyltransferase [Thermomonospora cellulosilytica]
MAASEVAVAARPAGSKGPAAAAAAPPAKVRDPYFDNAKFLAIVLVVVFHAVESLRDVPAVRAAYVFVYLFHMPVFIVVTGYLSRGFTRSRDRTRKLVVQLLVPYAIFETLYSLYFWAVSGGKPLEISLQRSSYLMWFLLALFLWRLSTPLWQRIRWPLGVAVGVCLLAFMTDLPRDLTLPRLLGLLPFYVLGLMLRPEHFEPLKRPAARAAGALVLAAAFAGALTVGRGWTIDLIFWNDPHHALGMSNVTGTVVRTAMLLAATVLVFAFLAVVPARRTWFTGLGAATLYAYLFHGFIVQVLRTVDFYEIERLHTVTGAAAVGAAAAVMATVLCTRPVVRATRRLVEPDVNWLFSGRANS